MRDAITTRVVCERLGLTESALRHLLRRPDAPRPVRHPSALLFLWSEDDVEALGRFRDELRRDARRNQLSGERA